MKRIVERALVLDKDGVIGLDDLPDRLRTPAQRIGNVRIDLPDEGISLEKVERELILTALEKHDWNQTRAAAYLDVPAARSSMELAWLTRFNRRGSPPQTSCDVTAGPAGARTNHSCSVPS